MFTYTIINEDKFTMVLPEDELAYDYDNEFEDVVSGRLGPGSLLSFNMRKVSFIDSAGVGFLVKMKNLAEKRNGSFEIRNLQKMVKLTLDKLTLGGFLNISTDCNQALSMRKTAPYV